MSTRRVVTGLVAGAGLALAVVTLLVFGSVVLAVSGGRTVTVPFLVTASSGTGRDVLGMAVEPFGILVWFLALTVLFGLPIALLRRRAPVGEKQR